MNSRRGDRLVQATRRRLLVSLGSLLALAVVLSFLFLRGWYTAGRHRAVPPELQVEAQVAGFPEEVRYFPRDPGDIKLIEKEFADSWEREKAFLHREDLPSTAFG
jgi:hypothetical protein